MGVTIILKNKKLMLIFLFLLVIPFSSALDNFTFAGNESVQSDVTPHNLFSFTGNYDGNSYLFGTSGSTETIFNFSTDFTILHGSFSANLNGSEATSTGINIDDPSTYFVYDKGTDKVYKYKWGRIDTGVSYDVNLTIFATAGGLDNSLSNFFFKDGFFYVGAPERNTFIKTTNFNDNITHYFANNSADSIKGIWWDEDYQVIMVRAGTGSSVRLVALNTSMIEVQDNLGFDLPTSIGSTIGATFNDGFRYLLSGSTINIYYTSDTTPIQIAEPLPFTLGYTAFDERSMDDYVTDYLRINISFRDPDTTIIQNLSTTTTGSSVVYNTSNITISLVPNLGDIILRVLSKTHNYFTEINITAINGDNNVPFLNPLTLNVSDVIQTPQQIASFAPFNLGFNSSEQRSFNDYFLYYDTILMTFTDPDTSDSEFLTATIGSGSSNTYSTNNISMTLTPTANDITILVESEQNNWTTQLNITASNTYGSLNAINLVQVTVNGSLPANQQQGITEDTFGNLLENIFPDAEELTLNQKLLYVVVTLLITMAIFLFAGISGESLKAFMIIGLVIVCLEFFFFVSIGYIPIIFIVILVLIATILGLLIASKSTTGG